MPPRIPGVPDLLGLLKQQTEALAQLPATVLALQRAVIALADTVGAARDTILIANRLALRMERLLDDLEAPVRALAPGLNRAAKLLDDPIVDTVPDTLRRIQTEAMPLLRAISETQNRLMQLPGAALLGAMTGQRARRTSEPPAPDA